MILVSFVVLLISLLLLVIGVVRSSAPVIWAAIGTSLVSAVLIFIGNRMLTKSRAANKAAAAPEPVGGPATPGVPAPAGAPGASATATQGAPPQPASGAAPPPTPPFQGPPPMGPRVAAPSGAPTETVPAAAGATAAEFAPQPSVSGPGPLPIADYDKLAVTAIVPQLPALSAEDLDRLRAHEASHMGRKTLLARIDAARKSKTAVVAAAGAVAAAGEVAAAGAVAATAAIAASDTTINVTAPPVESSLANAVAATTPIAPPPGTEEFAPPAEAALREVKARAVADAMPDPLPINGFIVMKAAEAQKALSGLDADDLLTMWEFEVGHGSRRGVLNRIEHLYLKSGDMPIEGYDGSAVNAIKPLLTELLVPELRAVRAYEETSANRKGIIAEIDKLLARAAL